jgi:hypothetical protein
MKDEDDKLSFEKAVSLGIVVPDSLRNAIHELTSGMWFSTRELKSKSPYVRFLAMTRAVEAVENFMEHISQFKRAQLHLPFRELNRCLYLLKDGVELPEFAIMRSPKSETSRTKFFKLRCAVATDLLMAAGRKRLDAARIVSKYWPELGLKPSTIADWRDGFIGNSSDPLSKEFKDRPDGFKALNLSEKDIELCSKTTTGDLRGIKPKRQTNRVMAEKKRG